MTAVLIYRDKLWKPIELRDAPVYFYEPIHRPLSLVNQIENGPLTIAHHTFKRTDVQLKERQVYVEEGLEVLTIRSEGLATQGGVDRVDSELRRQVFAEIDRECTTFQLLDERQGEQFWLGELERLKWRAQSIWPRFAEARVVVDERHRRIRITRPGPSGAGGV